MRCSASAQWRVSLIEAVRDSCKQSTTHPGLQSLLLQGINTWLHGQDQVDPRGYPLEIEEVARSQNSIGWRHILRGRWSHLWSRVQSRYLGQLAETAHPAGDAWNVKVIQILWEHWFDLWRQRNECVHGSDEKSRHEAERAILLRRMSRLYSQQGLVERDVENVFRKSIEHHMEKGTSYVRNWLAVHENLIRDSAARVRQRELRGMRPLEDYFGLHIDDPG